MRYPTEGRGASSSSRVSERRSGKAWTRANTSESYEKSGPNAKKMRADDGKDKGISGSSEHGMSEVEVCLRDGLEVES